jgi:hypothetical protein
MEMFKKLMVVGVVGALLCEVGYGVDDKAKAPTKGAPVATDKPKDVDFDGLKSSLLTGMNGIIQARNDLKGKIKTLDEQILDLKAKLQSISGKPGEPSQLTPADMAAIVQKVEVLKQEMQGLVTAAPGNTATPGSMDAVVQDFVNFKKEMDTLFPAKTDEEKKLKIQERIRKQIAQCQAALNSNSGDLQASKAEIDRLNNQLNIAAKYLEELVAYAVKNQS